jgi:hypothetical protein
MTFDSTQDQFLHITNTNTDLMMMMDHKNKEHFYLWMKIIIGDFV